MFSLISDPPQPRSVMVEDVTSDTVGASPESSAGVVPLSVTGFPVEGTTTTSDVETPSVVVQNDHAGWVTDQLVANDLLTPNLNGKGYRVNGPVGAFVVDKDGNIPSRGTQDMANRGDEKLPFLKVSGVHAGKSNKGIQISGCGKFAFKGVGRGKDESGTKTGQVSPIVAIIVNGIVHDLTVDGMGFKTQDLFDVSDDLKNLIFRGEGWVNTTYQHLEDLFGGLYRPDIGETVHVTKGKGLLMSRKVTSKAAIARRDAALLVMLDDLGREPMVKADDDDEDDDVTVPEYKVRL